MNSQVSSAKKRVLFVITKGNWGGAQRYVYDLATSLPREEFEVMVAFGQKGALADKLKERSIETREIASLQRDVAMGADVRSFFELRKLFKTLKPDIVHLNSSKAGAIGSLAARIARVPNIVFTIHGLPEEEDRGAISKNLIRLATKITVALSHHVIAISSDTKEKVKQSILIHNGIHPPTFLERSIAREALHLPQDAFVIGALGELTWNKNYHTLIRAAGDLKERGKNFLLCIMGDGEEGSFIETLIDEEAIRDRVILTGFVPNGAQYLKAYDVFVLPSHKEGLPYAALEAAHAGLPFAGSDIPGISEIAAGAGLLVNKKDHAGLADAIQKYMDDGELRTTLARKLEERVRKEFSLERMVDQTLQLYRN